MYASPLGPTPTDTLRGTPSNGCPKYGGQNTSFRSQMYQKFNIVTLYMAKIVPFYLSKLPNFYHKLDDQLIAQHFWVFPPKFLPKIDIGWSALVVCREGHMIP